ncbi:MAG: hypothetical protein J6V80_05145 [Clostridia bacterium]|nr:hypothetical protein [Clostridia bacterium]
MYSRSYYPDAQGRINPPDNYDGTAFIEGNADDIIDCEAQSCSADTETFGRNEPSSNGGMFSFLRGSPMLSGLFGKNGLLGNIGLSMPHIGTEEILILATAAFLFFSKGGDRECALILLFLLFIN